MQPSQLRSLTTESRNPNTMRISQASPLEILQMINAEDMKVAQAVNRVLPDVKTASDFAFESISNGGRLIYLGAGTSGRIGVMDAVECPPTYSISPDVIVGIMAGGDSAFSHAAEDVEDSEEAGQKDLEHIHLTSKDTVVGIAASGRTPYIIGALNYARTIGAKTVALSCNEQAEISELADCAIEVVVGAEAITGSTRMKAASAHKMILNMLSTSVMIRQGKVYENLMVDVKVSNHKLKERAITIIQHVTNASYEQAVKALEAADLEVKTAIVMLQTKTDKKTAGNTIQSIKDTASILNVEALEKAVQLLLNANQIHFIGVGASGIVAADAQQKFLRINYAATAFTDMHIASTVIANAGKNDIVFGISFSGETLDIIQALQLAKENEVKTIALTHPGHTSVSALCDVHLSTSGSNEAPFRSAATSSRMAQLYLIDVLFLSLASRQYEQTAQYIDKTRHAIRSMKRKTKGDST